MNSTNQVSPLTQATLLQYSQNYSKNPAQVDAQIRNEKYEERCDHYAREVKSLIMSDHFNSDLEKYAKGHEEQYYPLVVRGILDVPLRFHQSVCQDVLNRLINDKEVVEKLPEGTRLTAGSLHKAVDHPYHYGFRVSWESPKAKQELPTKTRSSCFCM